MAFDVDVDPEEVAKVAKYMTDNRDHIIERLTALLTQVTNLLSEEGGLYLRQASPVMSHNFIFFSHQLRDAINGIQNFGDNFLQTLKNLNDLDTGYAKDPDADNGSVDSVVDAPARTPA